MTVYSLAVEGVKNCSKNFANLLVGVPIAKRIVQKGASSLQLYEFYLTRIECYYTFVRRLISDFHFSVLVLFQF